MRDKQKRKWNPSRQAVRSALRAKHWSRIKFIDFPGGPVAIRDAGGAAQIHREHSRLQLRQMSRLAARRELRGIPQ